MPEANADPRITADGLADFMASTFYGREAILRRFKYEYPGQKVFAPYYVSAISAIRRYHRQGNDPAVFAKAIAELEQKLAFAKTDQARVRLESNIRAVTQYQTHFGTRAFGIVPQGRFPEMLVAGTTLTCNPDMVVTEDGTTKLLLLNCGVGVPDAETVATLCQLVHTASREVLNVPATSARLLDIPTGADLSWSGKGVTRWRQIEAACKNVAALWPLV